MTEMRIIGAWRDLDELRALATSGRPWMILEQTDDGIAVGPVFGGATGGCFGCFLRRRASTGTAELTPLRGALAPSQSEALAEHVAGVGSAEVAQTRRVIARDGSERRERLLPFPGCQHCRATGGWTPALGSIALTRGRDLGIVTHVEAWETDVPGIAVRHAVGARTDRADAPRAFNHGVAADIDPARAELRATAEALERYAAAFAPQEMRLARADELEEPAIEAARACPDDPESAQFRWIRGETLDGSGRVWLPAASVFIPYRAAREEAPLIGLTSCGLAAGPDLAHAVQHAVGEMVERDAFMRAWRLGVPVEQLHTDLLQVEGLHVVRIPTQVPLHVVAAFIERPEPPYTSVGLGTDTDFEGAVRGAVFEAVATRAWLCRWLALDGQRPPDKPRKLMEHAFLHAIEPRLAPSRKRWITAPFRRAADPQPGCWDRVVDMLPGAAYYDLTTPDVAAAGLRAVRAVVPGLLPLETDAARPVLSGGNAWPHPLG